MIERFQGKYYFLSNFEIEPDGSHVEGEFQASKTLLPSERKRILVASPSKARRFGKDKTLTTLRPDWEDIKVERMRVLIEAKFCTWTQYAAMLLATGDQELQEGNGHGDDFWGRVWDPKTKKWRGENALGKILMEIRSDITAARALVRRRRKRT